MVIAACVLLGIGLVYRTAWIVDCRRSSGQLERCWQSGPLVVSVDQLVQLAAASGVAGWVGFNTYNPSLRDPRRRDPETPPTS
jgi:hypothetical protein